MLRRACVFSGILMFLLSVSAFSSIQSPADTKTTNNEVSGFILQNFSDPAVKASIARSAGVQFEKTKEGITLKEGYLGSSQPKETLKPAEIQALEALQKRETGGILPPEFVFSQNIRDGYAIRFAGQTIKMRHLGSSADASFDPSALVYKNAYRDTDVAYFLSPGRCQEMIVLYSKDSPTKFAYDLKLEGKGEIAIDKNGELVAGGMTLSKPVVFDATGKKAEGQYRKADGKIILAFNPRGLKYPVLIDPAWISPSGLNTPREYHTATLLPNGKVLIAGGFDGTSALNNGELFDPANRWSVQMIGSSMQSGRENHTATLLPNGQVLLAGGMDEFGNVLSTADLYDYSQGGPTGQFTPASSTMNVPRKYHTATLLQDGTVLIAGGDDGSGSGLNSGELYDPNGHSFTLIASAMPLPRASHTATLLPNGRVLLAGGTGFGDVLSTADLYDPANGGSFIPITESAMTSPRYGHTATLLPNGKVLLAGGVSIEGEPAFMITGTPEALTTFQNITDGAFTVDIGINPSLTEYDVTNLDFTTGFGGGTDPVQSYDDVASVITAGLAAAASPNPAPGGCVYYAPDQFFPGGAFLFYSALEGSAVEVTPLISYVGGGTDISHAIGETPGYMQTATPVGSAAAFRNAYGGEFHIDVNGQGYDVPNLSFFAYNHYVGVQNVWDVANVINDGLISAGVPASCEVNGSGDGFLFISNTAGSGTTVSQLSSVVGGLQVDVSQATHGYMITTNPPASELTLQGVPDGEFHIDIDGSGYDITGLNFAGLSYIQIASAINDGLAAAGAPAVCVWYPDVGGGYDAFLFTSVSYGSNSTVSALSSVSGGTGTDISVDTYLNGASGYSVAGSEYLNGADIVGYTPSSPVTTQNGTDAHTYLNGAVGVAIFQLGSDPAAFSLKTANLFDYTQGTYGLFSSTGSLVNARQNHTATLTPSGEVLLVGGYGGTTLNNYLYSAELFDPTGNGGAGTFTSAGSLIDARQNHTATLLSDGTVFVAGGYNGSSPLQTTEFYTPYSGAFSYTANNGSQTYLATGRYNHTATLLPDGFVLIAGGSNESGVQNDAELYNPASDIFTSTAPMTVSREGHTATLLSEFPAKVLIAGGHNDSGAISSAEVYNYDSVAHTGTFSPVGSMVNARYNHTATLLPDGTVLMVGGSGESEDLFSAELYYSSLGQFSATGSMPPAAAREGHTATLLLDGRVLIAGGYNGDYLRSGYLYDPSSGTFSYIGLMGDARSNHTATLLPTGKVLVAGGFNGTSYLQSAELFNPSGPSFSYTQGSSGQTTMVVGRGNHTATLLPNGKVLIAGGINGTQFYSSINNAEEYDPSTGMFTEEASGDMIGDVGSFGRSNYTATLLPTGKVLMVAGTYGTTFGGGFHVSSSAELARYTEYDYTGKNMQPVITAPAHFLTFPLQISQGQIFGLTGDGLTGTSEASGGNGSANSPTNYPRVYLQRMGEGGMLFDVSATEYPINWSGTQFSLPFTVPSNLPAGYYLMSVVANGVPSDAQIMYNYPGPAYPPSAIATNGIVWVKMNGKLLDPHKTTIVPMGASVSPEVEVYITAESGVYNAGIKLNGSLFADLALEAGGTASNGTWEVQNASVPRGAQTIQPWYNVVDGGGFVGPHYEGLTYKINLGGGGGGVQVVGQISSGPNPFKPLSGGTTQIQYTLNRDASIILILYDITGHEVKRMKFGAGTQGGQAGGNTVTWNGTGLSGKVVGNGMYLYKIISGDKIIGDGRIIIVE